VVILSLIPHPDFPSVAVDAIRVAVVRDGGALDLTFTLVGDPQGVSWPPFGEHGRADELWKTTCFEAFVQPDGMSAYTELNFAPSGRWAAYSFTGYREGMSDFEPELGEVAGGMLAKGGALPRSSWQFWTFDVLGEQPWRLGLSAVIEATDGTKSYWALAHPPGKPDFHNADCFTARLAAPERA
jgi:hypothetical protein